MRTVLACLSPFLVAAACAVVPPPQEIVLDRDDIVVRGDVVVRPGSYRVRDANGDGVLNVVGDGVTVTLTGVTLDGADDEATPDQFEGIGVAITGAARVRVVGGALCGFRVAVRGERCAGLQLDGIDVSDNRAMRLRSTPAREDAADWLWPHENDHGEWQTRYGAGIALTDCDRATVQSCRARSTQNGLLLTRCGHATVRANDFSFLSGWGIAMYRCTHGKVRQNRCDFCVRGYSDGVYARGQDSAGILMFEQCSDNEIVGNSATHGGDGLFLYAGHETTQRTGKGGSNDNRVEANDFSFAVANGIEATFSRGNRFVGNRLDGCDHGVWAGYSYETEIRGNSIQGCNSGVSIEHGHDNRIVDNEIVDCARGVHLWWDDDKELLASAYGRNNDTGSARNTVRGNRIVGGTEAVVQDGDTGSAVDGNGTAAVSTEAAADADLPARPAELPRGRDQIVIGEWGPLDPRRAAVVPFGASGSDAMTMRVVGAGLPFRVITVTEGFAAEPRAGTAPAVLRVRPIGERPAAVEPWAAVLNIGPEPFVASGYALAMGWQVRWWRWQTDPREDPAAWAALLATPPLDNATTDALDFDWGMRAPTEKVPADQFATVAETTCTLPAGPWRLRTVSDDGIRVSVDGRVVIDDWTWHASKANAGEVELDAGPHTIRVEHFELDGAATLRCWLEPVAQ